MEPASRLPRCDTERHSSYRDTSISRLCLHQRHALKYIQLVKVRHVFLTFPPVELRKACTVAVGQVGGASEGRRRKVGHQWAVTQLCSTNHKTQDQELGREIGLHP